ncbi:MAG: hypothetical protein CMJ94_06290 [Planctomycetes bacterium]|nr:hypothetical protein [Planctomycetota bacterium]
MIPSLFGAAALVPGLLMTATPAQQAVSARAEAPSDRVLELRANTYTRSTQADGALDIAPNGNVFVAWSSRRQEMGSYGVFGQVFDALGRPIGTELHINEFMPNGQLEPAVAYAPDGAAWVAWTSYTQDGDAGGIYLRRLESQGEFGALAPVGTDILVPEVTKGDQVDPSIAALADGSVVVTWLRAEAGGRTAVARVFDRAGQPVSAEFRLGEVAEGSEALPSVAAMGDAFVAAWARTAADGRTPRGVFVRGFDARGEALGSELLISAGEAGAVEPVLDAHADGFAVAWMSLDEEQRYQVRAQAFGADLAPRSAAATIAAPAEGFQNGATVAVDESGAYTVLFNRYGLPVEGEHRMTLKSQVYAQDFAADGRALTAPSVLGSPEDHRDLQVGLNARHAVRSEGRLAVAWNGDIDGDGNAIGLTLRVPADFTLPAPPEVTPIAALAELTRAEVDEQIVPPEWDPNWVDDADADPFHSTRSNSGFRAFTSTGWNPPDPDLAVGPNHIVAVVNVDMRFFDKDGNQQFNTGLESWFGSNGFVFDPVALYDPHANRFVIAAAEHNNGDYFRIAVSDDDNPNGTWYKYRVNVSSICGFIDFENLGCSSTAYSVAADCFGGGGNYIHVMEKAPMLTGGAMNVQSIQASASLLSNGTTKNYDNDVIYSASSWTLGSPKLKLYAVTGAVGSATLEKVNLDVGAWNSPPGAQQLGTSNRAATIDTRIKNGVVRDGHMYLCHNVGFGGACKVRWYKIDLQGWPNSGQRPQLVDSGYVDPGSGIHTWFGDINVSADGNMAIAYNRSSSSEYIGVYFSWRAASDAPGTLRDFIELKTSNSPENGSRWGDYAGLEEDPVVPGKFWNHHEFRTSSWRTWIDGCETGGSGYPLDLQLGGALVAGTTASATVDGTTPFAQVYLYNGSGPGSTTVPGVGTLDIANGNRLMTRTANAAGTASFVRTLPGRLAGFTVWLQAIDEFGALSQIVNEQIQ